ncbi:MAG: preprotein translocase subunit SecG [Chloroflexi bacterium OLB15]|nr:MAG: preprotein translocase subunit SecG [Chloroflexi bacterium OLB15]
MQAALYIAAIIISVALIVIILLQVKGSGLGDLLGGSGDSGVTRTRRGLEKTLYQITIGLSFAFLLIAILSVYFSR